MTTMKRVAEEAHVSISTVSHVINNTRKVSDKTAKAVLDTIARLNYQPNSVAASLRKKSTKTIGVLIADMDNECFVGMLRSFEENLYRWDYNMILCNSDEKPEKERFYLELLTQKQIDGVILIPTCENTQFIHALWEQGLPMVFVDRYIPGIDAPYVGMNNYKASCLAIERLIATGAKSIHMIYSLASLTAIVERKDGYYETARAHGIEVSERTYIEISDANDMDELLRVLNERYRDEPLPDAFFVASNKIILHLAHYFKTRGIRCPQDVRIVGFGLYAWAEDFSPQLEIISPPVEEVARLAVEQLMGEITGTVSKIKRTIVPASVRLTGM